MGHSAEGATDSLQTRLDKARQGGAVQTQRRHARTDADRRHAFPGHGNPGQPRRQGEAARHCRLEIRRRVTPTCHPPTPPRWSCIAATPPRFDRISKTAPWWWWKAQPYPLCIWSHHHARPWTSSELRWHWLVLLVDLHARGIRLAIFCLMWPAT